MNSDFAWRILLTLPILGVLLTISACGAPAAGLELAPAVFSTENAHPTTQVIILETVTDTPSPLVDTPTPHTSISPAVTISPTSGPPGTLVQVVATGFPPHAPLSVGLGPMNSEFTEVVRDTTDANGQFTVQISVQGAGGMDWVFGVSAGEAHATSVAFHITGGNPAVTISPTSGPPGTLVQVVATGFPPRTPVIVWMGPERAGFGEVTRGVTDLNGAFTAQVPVENAPGMNLVFAVGTGGEQGASAPEMFHVTDAPGAQPTPQTGVPTLETFEASLTQAVEAHDFDLLRSLMGDSFGLAGWRSEGRAYTPGEAIEQLRLNYLRADNAIRFQDPPDLSQQLGGRGILSVWNPAVNPVSAPFSVGWGADGRTEAFLIIAQRPDGVFYWEGILLTPGGFVESSPYPVLETDVRYVMVLPDFVPMYDGPGDSYTRIGEIFGGMAGTVTGVSSDGQWWRVMCPDDTVGNCWISADPALTQPTTPPGS